MDKSDRCTNLNTLYLAHVGILLVGMLVGLTVAYWVSTLTFDFSAELRRAAELGIVSTTIIRGYAKSKDIVGYAAIMGLPLLTAIATWSIWARQERRAALLQLFPEYKEYLPSKDMLWRLCLVVVIVTYLLGSFNINFFYQANRGWPLLGEEGENLAWAQAILAGKVYGKDFFCLYGPLLIYPLAWAMKLFGVTVATARGYAFGLNLAAYGIIITFLYATFRGRSTFVAAAVAYLLAFPSLAYLSPNCTYLRVALGVLPLLFAYQYQQTGRRVLLAASGGAIGVGLLFSQEVAICSAIALACCIVLHSVAGRDYKELPGRVMLIAAGGLATLAPMMIYLFAKGALGPFFATLYGYPKLVTLGYGALPFPGLADFIAAPRGSLLHYAVIAIYLGTAVTVIPLLLLGRITRDNILQAGLLVFGALLFRSALGRSDGYHVYYASQPAFLLVLLAIDRAVCGIRRPVPVFVKAGNVLAAGGLILFLCFLFIYSQILGMGLFLARSEVANFSAKWSRIASGTELRWLERGGVFFDRRTNITLAKIKMFLDTNTSAGDYVYFFPNEAAYYFLFNRNNPTHYAIAYFAVTSAQRRELIADLEKNKPRYIVYSLDTWRVDDIPENRQVPEVVDYMQQNYRLAQDMGELLILERIAL